MVFNIERDIFFLTLEICRSLVSPSTPSPLNLNSEEHSFTLALLEQRAFSLDLSSRLVLPLAGNIGVCSPSQLTLAHF